MISLKIVIILLFIIAIIYVYHSKMYENYSNYGDDTKLSNRQKTIHLLNKQRGELGRFKIDCDSCTTTFMNELTKLPKKSTDKKTMSFFNTKYVEIPQTYCYNCIIDADSKNKESIQTYGSSSIHTYKKLLNDPINGPPMKIY